MGVRYKLPVDLANCANFELDEKGLTGSTPTGTATFRDPAALEVLRKLAISISENEGYPAGEVRPAKGIDAGFTCELGSGCKLSVLLGVSGRKDRVIRFDLITEWYPPIFGRLVRRPASLESDCVQRWKTFLSALNRQLDNALGATPIVLLTDERARELWTDRADE